MTPRSAPRGDGRRTRLVSIGLSDEYDVPQLLLAAVVVLSPVAFVACAVLGGAALSWWWLVLAPVGLLLVPQAESLLPLLLWSLLLVVWVSAVPQPFTWWSVPAAMVLATSHAALTLLAGRPTAGGLSPETLGRTARRLGVLLVAVLGVALVSQGVSAARLPGALGPAVAALLAVAGWIWWGGRAETEPGPPPE